MQQRINIMFCHKLGYTFVQTKTALTTVYGGATLSDSRIYFWLQEFARGHTQVLDLHRQAKPKTGRSRANIRKVEDKVANDCRISVSRIAAETGLKRNTVHLILKKDLKLTKKCAKYTPTLLNETQKARRMELCHFWNHLYLNQPQVFKHLVTMDESWIYLYDPHLKETTKEWLRKDEPRPQKPRRGIGVSKTMIVTFFDSQGLIYYEFVQCPATVNQIVFRQIFQKFHQACLRRHPRAIVNGRRFIHMDNASPHNAFLSLQLVRTLGWTRIPHLAYSPDLAPNDFFFYARVKRNLRGEHHGRLELLKQRVEEEIGQISAMEYCNCMLVSWRKHWLKCLEHHGGYFEGI